MNQKNEILYRTCYCIVCNEYFNQSTEPRHGISLEGTDMGLCDDCISKEDPYLIIGSTISFIKDMYIVSITDNSFQDKEKPAKECSCNSGFCVHK